MIRGIVSAVPANIVRNTDESFIKMTGVQERRIAPDGFDVGDYAFFACEKLMAALGWKAEDLGAIIFVTQTPQVRMPAMACKIAGALGANCAAFDVNMACSGYVYGLHVADCIAQANGRVILIAGDTVSRMCDINDKSTYPLFGDCVTATAIDADGFDWHQFVLGTDGSGFASLIADPLIRMDGTEVMNFALKTVPKLVADTTMNAHVDWYFFHQANSFILKHLTKKCGLDAAKVPMNIEKYGNTSSASIPLLMCNSWATNSLKTQQNRVAMFGFGAGWSWGGVMLDLEPLQVCEVVEV